MDVGLQRGVLISATGTKRRTVCRCLPASTRRHAAPCCR